MNAYISYDLLQNLSDNELISQYIVPHQHRKSRNMSFLSQNLVVKKYRLDEVEDIVQTIALARKLGIRTPRIRRIARDKHRAYCIMDRVQGDNLEDAWATIGWYMTIKLAFQLRRFVKTLRSLKSPTAGALVSGACRSFWLDYRHPLPPNPTPTDISNFFRWWTSPKGINTVMQKPFPGKSRELDIKDSPCLEVQSFVFTHHDLAPRNLMITPTGNLCLIDWDFAGFYPIYFEYASMQNFRFPKDWGFLEKVRWFLFTWISVGRSEQTKELLNLVKWRCDHAA